MKELFVVSAALLLYSFFPDYKVTAVFLWPWVALWVWLRWLCKAQLKIPFTWQLLRFAPHIALFWDSIKSLKIPRIIALSAPLFALSFFLVRPCLTLWLPLFILSSLFLFRFPQKKKPAPDYQWRFPTEIARFLLPDYPLFRKTYGFTGKKRFEPLCQQQKPHILFLFLESFRAKNIGCLGAAPAASPHFDALAEQGILFTQFYANGLQTFRALLSSFFGIPAHLNTMTLQSFCSLPLIGLPEILKENGYQTAHMQASCTAFDWSFPFLRKHGFDTILGRESFSSAQKTSWGITDETLFQHAFDWLQKQEKPTFLSLFTISNHHPWESPIPFASPPHLPEPYRRFLQTFSYTDHCLGQFVKKLKQSGLLEKSVLFIMGDHGQEMGERGAPFACHNDLFQENIHIPLLLLANQKGRCDQPASQVDLLPTVLDLLQLRKTVHHSVGRSLLRESNAPVFFSMPRQETKIGSIRGSVKCILGAQQEEFYRLPDEKTPLPPSEERKQETISYFQTVEKLYARSAFAPLSWEKIPFEIKAPTDATDAQWEAFVKKSPPSPLIDLSHASFLTDRAIQAIADKGAHLHEIKLCHSLFFTDRALKWIAENCPYLSILDASHCLLMTDEGVNAVLQQCLRLCHLSLEGNEDIADLQLQNPCDLQALHLKDCHNLSGAALARLLRQCPQLHYLTASLKKTEDAHLEQIAPFAKEWLYLWLENGETISDTSLNALLKPNEKLSILLLENFPHVRQLDLSKKRALNTVKFAHCPQLTDETLASLEGLPIQHLEIIHCPAITEKGLQKIDPNCTVHRE